MKSPLYPFTRWAAVVILTGIIAWTILILAVAYGEEIDAFFAVILFGKTGAVVGILLVSLSIYMIVKRVKKLRE